eukprot:scaffold2346_cov71-Phaeocystis_antarctica.AAC.3
MDHAYRVMYRHGLVCVTPVVGGQPRLCIQEDIQYFTGLSNAICILARQLRLGTTIMSHNRDPWTI